MLFDFFTIKIKADSKNSDEYFLGYFFGKPRERLEYRFINFPRRYARLVSIDLHIPLPGYKEYMNSFFQEMMGKSAETSSMTGEFARYLDYQVKKQGGPDALSSRLAAIIEENSPDLVRAEIQSMFDNWTSGTEIDFLVETSTFEQVTSEFMSDKESSISAFPKISARDDLISIPEVYPIVDPIDGTSIDEFDIGDPLFCTLLGFLDDEQKSILMEAMPDCFDVEGKNTVPIEGTLVSKELLPSPSKNHVLIKVQIGESVIAKSIVLRTIRLMYDPSRMRKRLRNLQQSAQKDSMNLADVMAKMTGQKTNRLSQTSRKEKKKHMDFALGMLLTLLLVGLILIISYYFFFS